MKKFKLISDFKPKGDQPQAIEKLAGGIQGNRNHQVLLGVTGSGKTFTVANVIAKVQKPTLVIAPNKILAAQLYGEFMELFPENAVEYFVSYYDYYQPEAYIPRTDTYIQKDASINEEIDKMRHSATRSLLERNDVIIVASVSCIYGLGSPEAYSGMLAFVQKGTEIPRDEFLAKLVEIRYERNDLDFYRGTFRVKGDVVEVFPAYEADKALRIEFFGDEVDSISEVDPLRGNVIKKLDKVAIYPGSHYVTTREKMKGAIKEINAELKERILEFYSQEKLIEAQRIEERTNFDLEMLEEVGYCTGIENYSRHLTGRKPGKPPPTLMDYFPSDYLVVVDESHVTIPQLNGMFLGDRSRKSSLVEHGFRLPSAMDNRPLMFKEFQERVSRVIYVSATPADYELKRSQEYVVEQIIRPTGIIDPKLSVKPADSQVDDLFGEIQNRVGRKQRTLITTLTKRMAENLCEYYDNLGLKIKYLHSDIDTLERTEIIRDLRLGKFDVLVGINLLREGLDIPEVSLVAILDADKEGFLRSAKSLIQTCGRAARNVEGEVIMYADHITGSMEIAIRETERRRKIQKEFNRKNRITPENIKKSIRDILNSVYEADYYTVPLTSEFPEGLPPFEEIAKLLKKLEDDMRKAAKSLKFEEAAAIRDKIRELKKGELGLNNIFNFRPGREKAEEENVKPEKRKKRGKAWNSGKRSKKREIL